MADEAPAAKAHGGKPVVLNEAPVLDNDEAIDVGWRIVVYIVKYSAV